MVIGLRHAAIDAADTTTRASAHEKAEAVLGEFARCNGSLLCRDLIGCDLRTAEGQRQFKDSDALQKVCVKAIRAAVEIVEQVLAEKENA
jgi:hypothetical protein